MQKQQKLQVFDNLLNDKLERKLENVESLGTNNNKNLKSIQQEFIKLDQKIQQRGINQLVIGGGCFWCIEAMLQRIQGVLKTQVGYSGGHIHNPEYEQVKSGQSGHAEVIRITYNETQISFFDILYVFMNIHDPTTLNRQMYDKGTQYRSIIFYKNQEEKEIAEEVIDLIQQEGIYEDPIVTELKQFEYFYVADKKHWNFYEQNPEFPYCRKIINPKMKKFMKNFSQITK